MKSLGEMNHYEILEVPRDAARGEIERAYALAMATYSTDSMALYTLFGEGEAEAIRERVEQAYRVLADPAARLRYDSVLEEVEPSPPPPSLLAQGIDVEDPVPAPELAPQIEGLEDLDDELQAPGFDGARLRRARLRRGFELEQIAKITKINPTYLRFLEEDYFSGLPAAVYVRGFVAAYARCVGLDPTTVSASYMQRYSSTHPTDPRRRSRRKR